MKNDITLVTWEWRQTICFEFSEVYTHHLEQQKEKNHNQIRKTFETFGAD